MSPPSRQAKQLSSDLSKSLGAAVSQTGAMDISLQRRLKAAADDLERSLRNYDRLAQSLTSQTPQMEQLEKIVQDRVPSDYRNKAYKRLFWRTVYKTVPFLRQKKKTEDEINTASREALVWFSVVFRSIIGYSNGLLSHLSASEDEDADPEDFDSELESTVLGLEKAVLPSPGSDPQQKKTNDAIKKNQTGAPTSGVTTEEEFKSYVSAHESLILNPKSAFSRKASDVQRLLTYSSERAFALIHQSTLKAAALGQVYVSIAADSRKKLVPGTYVAASSFIRLITLVNQTVIQSVATNRAQRNEINQNLKSLQKQQIEDESEDDS